MKKLLFILLALPLFGGCKTKPESSFISFESIIIDTIYLPFSIQNTPFEIFPIPNQENKIGFLQWQEWKYTIYDLDTYQTVDQFYLQLGNEVFANYSFTANMDSLYLLLHDNSVMLYEREKKLKWDLNKIKNEIDSTGRLLAGFAPLRVWKDSIALLLYPSLDLETEEYLRNINYVFIKLDTNNGANLYHKRPVYNESFFKSKPFVIPNATWVDNGTYIQSYATLDSLFYIDINKNTTHSFSTQTNLMNQNDTFNLEKINDPSYTVQFEVENGYISQLKYNAATKNLYAFIKHAQTYIDADGNKTKFFDCPFSIIVYNSEFQKINEITIPAKKIGFTYLTFISDNKLYIPANESMQNINDKTKFYIIDLHF